MAPTFMFNSYIAILLGSFTPASTVILTIGAFGLGQVLTNAAVPKLSRIVAPRALVLSRIAVTVLGLTVAFFGASHAPALIPAAAIIGIASGLIITPQQSRFFLEVPAQAPVAMGLNGSAIYVSAAGGAAIGGLALQRANPAAIALTGGVLAATTGMVLALRHHT